MVIFFGFFVSYFAFTFAFLMFCGEKEHKYILLGRCFLQIFRTFAPSMKNMKEITIQSIAEDQNIDVGYSDDDIVIIDNVKTLMQTSLAMVNMNLITVGIEGKAQGVMNGRMVEIHKNQVVICPPNVSLCDFMMSPDFEFKAMFLTNRILQSFLREKMSVWNEVMYIHKMNVLTMDWQDVEFYSHFYDMLKLCIDYGKDDPYHTDIIYSLLRGAFLGVCGRLKKLVPQTDTSQGGTAGTSLFQRFLDLLNSGDIKHRTVNSYADELFVTPKYLSSVCKKCSGKTANEWITEHVVEDIRYYLQQTDLSIKQVCNQLGFANPSFFGKYVKEHFGMTPMQIRRNM